jgi:hypothetical protein
MYRVIGFKFKFLGLGFRIQYADEHFKIQDSGFKQQMPET